MFGPAARLVEGYHALQYEAMRADEPEGTADLLEQMDWYVSIGCASHDCQHALEWGMAGLLPDTDMSSLTTDLWAVIESLRNSYDQLHRHLAHFVHSKLSISDAPTDRQEHYAYWIALGVESEVADHLADLRVRWTGAGQLVVPNEALIEGWQTILTDCMLSVFQFKQFTHSRWTTVGQSCRTLAAALSLGLQGLVGYIRSLNKSEYYIKSFGKLNGKVLKYVCGAAVIANVADAVLVELLADDRLAIRVYELQDLMQDELTWLSELGEDVWLRLGSLCDVAAKRLRMDCLRAASVSAAYVDFKALTPAKGYPWTLCRGDIKQNLFFLTLEDEPEDPTAAKIQQLMAHGYNVDLLAEGVQRVGDVHWSTVGVEQAHGSAATIHRFHPDYEVQTLVVMYILHIMRSLLPKTGPTTYIDQRLEWFAKKQPHKAHGRSAFFAQLMQAVKDFPPEQRGEVGRMVMKAHGQMWNELSLEQQAHYVEEAAEIVQSKRDDIDIQMALLSSQRERKVLEADMFVKGGQLRMSACVLTTDDIELICCRWNSGEYTRASVEDMRKAAVEPPQIPRIDVQHAIKRMVLKPLEQPERHLCLKSVIAYMGLLSWHRLACGASAWRGAPRALVQVCLRGAGQRAPLQLHVHGEHSCSGGPYALC